MYELATFFDKFCLESELNVGLFEGATAMWRYQCTNYQPILWGIGMGPLRALTIKDKELERRRSRRRRRMEQLTLVPHHLPDTFLRTMYDSYSQSSQQGPAAARPPSSRAECFSNMTGCLTHKLGQTSYMKYDTSYCT